MKIVLITTGQPSINPRIVKEADVLSAFGHDVYLLYSYWIDWAEAKDKDLFLQKKWVPVQVGGNRKDKILTYYLTRSRQKLAKLLYPFVGNYLKFAERAQARCFDEMLESAVQLKADWYIGHNLGALAICARAARKTKSKYAFDFEDYHRGEEIKYLKSQFALITYLEETYLPQAEYLSASSELIAEKVQSDFKQIMPITVYNCFSKDLQPPYKAGSHQKGMSLFWFSQTIGPNRGLEFLMRALGRLTEYSISFNLAGRLDDEFKDYLQMNFPSEFKRLTFLGIIAPDEIPIVSSAFDIGVSLEQTSPVNRDLCLTNKIFTYLLSGNAIILTNTKMQRLFNEKYKIGKIINEGNVEELVNTILHYYNNPAELEAQKIHNYRLGSLKLNWENESRKILELIN